jgi:SAM-dependent methyltransferase
VADTLREVRWLARALPIAPTDVVLDVGSGSHPNLRSNVLCDKFPWDGTERHGAAIALDRPFVVGDVEALPFADRAFDFVICSHVLEHLEHPERAVAELQRVAPRGYIETPSATWERLAGFAFHRWMVARDGDRLVFTAKRAPVEDPDLTGWFTAMQSALGLREYMWWRRRVAGVYTSLVWDGAIEVEVDRSGAGPADAFAAATDGGEEPLKPAAAEGRVARGLARYGRRLRRRSEVSPGELAARLRCPSCHGRLDAVPGGHRCTACAADYPGRGAPFPVLVAP